MIQCTLFNIIKSRTADQTTEIFSSSDKENKIKEYPPCWGYILPNEIISSIRGVRSCEMFRKTNLAI
jgi:hypothetical protein